VTTTERAPDVHIELLGRFQCAVRDEPQKLPMACQRLIAFLALHDRPLQRTFVASSLWLEQDEQRATANLRSALWRLSSHTGRFVVSDRSSIALAESVSLDLRSQSSVAYRLVSGDRAPAVEGNDDGDGARRCQIDGVDQLRLLSNDLLPDWYDDWLVLERERLRQLRLNALDRLSGLLLAAGSLPLAMDTAYVSIAAEPLRESAHRALIAALLAAGNRWEALRQYDRFRDLLADALGLEPSADLRKLVDEAVHAD
jgi:DNA-binding SARP family transcriptional activator